MVLIVPVEPTSRLPSPPPPPPASSGTRQYKRDCQLVIAQPSGKEFDLSAMRISFKIHHYQRDLQPKWMEVRVYNVQTSTAKAIQACKEGGWIRLEAGYVGNIGRIFEGQIKWVNIGRENPVDTYVDIWAGDGENAHNFATVSKTFKAGSKPQDHLNEIANQYAKFGVNLGIVNVDLSVPIYPRAFTLFGMASEALRVLAKSKDSTAWVHMSKLNISDNKKADKTGIIELNAVTGMVGMPVLTTDGVLVRALINPRFATDPPPKIKLNNGDINQSDPIFRQMSGGPGDPAGLQVDPNFENRMKLMKAADGVYQVFYVEWTGDTRGQPWYADLTCGTLEGAPLADNIVRSLTTAGAALWPNVANPQPGGGQQ